MLHDTDRLSPKERGFVVAHGLRGNTVASWVKQLKAHEATRVHKRKNSVVLTHELLSFHAADTNSITPEKLERLTREYIRLRGNGKFLAVPHYDKSHYHVHILASGVDVNGKAMRMSRSELGELKKKIQQYQVERYPELSKSLPTHGRKSKLRVTDKEIQMKKRTKKQTTRERVAEMVNLCRLRSRSDEKFFVLLSEKGMEVYQRGGKPYGVLFNERKYRFATLGMGVNLNEKDRLNERRHTLQGLRSLRSKSKISGRHR